MAEQNAPPGYWTVPAARPGKRSSATFPGLRHKSTPCWACFSPRGSFFVPSLPTRRSSPRSASIFPVSADTAVHSSNPACSSIPPVQTTDCSSPALPVRETSPGYPSVYFSAYPQTSGARAPSIQLPWFPAAACNDIRHSHPYEEAPGTHSGNHWRSLRHGPFHLTMGTRYGSIWRLHVILGSKVLVSLICSRVKYLRAFYLLSIFKA